MKTRGAEGTTPAGEAEGKPQSGPLLILNVNDSEAGRYATTRILLKNGFDVIEAATGRQAVAMATERPDLVLLDIKLPDIDGFEVCRRLKEDRVTEGIPVVFLSATYRDSPRIAEGLDMGGDGYLTEPVEPEVLVATVKAALRARRAHALAAAEQARLAAVLSLVDQPVALIDSDGVIERINPAMGVRIEAAGRGPAVGRTCTQVFGEQMVDATARVRNSLGPVALDMGDKMGKGSMAPVTDESGVFQGIVLTLATPA